MSLDRDLFLTILAMDSYNRDYHPGIKVRGSKLGNAKVIDRVSIGITTNNYSDWKNSDFYASFYEFDGETVISYRGTDNLLADANTGYGLGAGVTDLVLSTLGFEQLLKHVFGTDFGTKAWLDGTGVTQKSQSDLAIDFYQKVTGQLVHNAATPANVVAVGHSLGGGLAGLISTLSGVEGHGYDHMPFAAGAFAEATKFLKELIEGGKSSEILQEILNNIGDEFAAEFTELVGKFADLTKANPAAFAAAGLHAPSTANFSAEHVEGELLEKLRNGDYILVATFVAGFIAVLTDNPAAAELAQFGYTAYLQQVITESAIDNEPIKLWGALSQGSAVDKHSQALLVLLKYALVNNIDPVWHAAAAAIIDATYDPKPGRTVTSAANDNGREKGARSRVAA